MYDKKPRKVDATSAQILSNIAELAMREMEKKWAMQLERACLDHVLRSLDCYDQGFLFVEASRAEWQIIHVSPAAAQETGALPLCLPFLTLSLLCRPDHQTWLSFGKCSYNIVV